MHKTAIIAAAKGYTVNDLTPWVSSLKETGFDGKVFVILYEPTQEVAEYLKSNDFYVLVADVKGPTHIATQRFLDYASALKSGYFDDVDLVIHTDIRDVIFQENPDTWLRDNIEDYHIIATGEGVTYRHEDWNGDGLEKNFGKAIFTQMANLETLCSGIIAGRKAMLIQLFESIYEITSYTTEINGFIDQHVYNLLINKCFSNVTKIAPANSEWVANMGTLVAIPASNPSWSSGPRSEYNSYERFRKGTYNSNMLVEVPKLEDGIVLNESNKPYAIIHQYDRTTVWRDFIFKKRGYPISLPMISSSNFRNQWDKQIYKEVYLDNEYNVPESFSQDDVIIDIGAHIGFFTRLCFDRGAGTVISLEANPLNYSQLNTNLKDYSKADHRNLAVWRSDKKFDTVKIFLPNGEENTGLSTAITDKGVDVNTISLDEILFQYDKVRMLKIDAEGAEYPILLTAKNLSRVQEIVGEIHEYDTLENISESTKVPGYEKYTRDELKSYLESQGFSVEITPTSWSSKHAFLRAVKNC